MQNRTLLSVLVTLLAVLSVVASSAQTHILSLLVTTNRPGDYPLHPAWIGVEKVTVHTGQYSRDDEVLKFHFDRLTVLPNPILPRAFENRFICETVGSNQVPGSTCGYCLSLPTDSELIKMREDSSVTNLFGLNPFLAGMSKWSSSWFPSLHARPRQYHPDLAG